MKQLIFLVLFSCALVADFVDDFNYGKYIGNQSIYYSLGEASLSQKNYKSIALLNAKAALGASLISSLSTHQKLTNSVKTNNGVEEIESSFYETSSMDVSNLPLLGVKTLYTRKKNASYYLLVKFSFKEVSRLYISQANSLAKEIDENYEHYKVATRLILKEKLLKNIKNLYENYMSYAQMCALMKVKYATPKVSSAKIDNHLFNLYDEESTNIADLAKVLVSRLALYKINKALEILPIGYEEKFNTTKFSHKLKHSLQNELYTKVEVTKAVFTPFKLIGTYTLTKDILEVHIVIVNKNAKVIDSALAKMSIKDKTFFDTYSQESANLNEPYTIMENYFENW